VQKKERGGKYKKMYLQGQELVIRKEEKLGKMQKGNLSGTSRPGGRGGQKKFIYNLNCCEKNTG